MVTQKGGETMKLNVRTIKILMAENGLTGVDVSKLSGISRQSISNILSRGTCSNKSAGMLASALNVGVETICKEDQP